jgi:hypothetical protein
MDPAPPCPECFVLTEKLRRVDSMLKRAQADLAHAKMTGQVRQAEKSEDIAANMPDPDTVPEPTNPATRFTKRPQLEF